MLSQSLRRVPADRLHYLGLLFHRVPYLISNNAATRSSSRITPAHDSNGGESEKQRELARERQRERQEARRQRESD